MSNQINSNLFERAVRMIDEWDGTIMAKLIEHDIETNDLDSLARHVKEAEDDLGRQEDFVVGENDVY